MDLTQTQSLVASATPPASAAMAELIRTKDWSLTPLGPRDQWCAGLRIAVSTVLDSPIPAIILWGRQLIQIYNESYSKLLGARHPAAMGQPTQECWPEVWFFNEPIYAKALRGESVYVEDQSYEITPSGLPRTHYFSVSYAPARDEIGAIGGVMVTVTEGTDRVLAAHAQASQLALSLVQTASLKRLFDQAPGWVTVMQGPDHVFELANEAYFDLVGRRDILGKSLREALPESLNQGFIALLDEVYESGTVYRTEALRYVRPGQGTIASTEFFLDLVYQPLAGPTGEIVGILAMGNDVTERQRAQAKLKDFSDSVPALTWLTSAAGQVEHCNERWYEYTGLSPATTLGDNWLVALHPEDRAMGKDAWQRAVTEEFRYEVEYRLRRHDGEYRWFLTRAVPHRDLAGQVLNWFGTSTDIDSVKRLEAALELADHHKDQFVATLAHELRGPLSPILSAAEVLALGRVGEEAAARLHEIIRRQATNMGLLLDELLDLSRVSRGRVELHRSALRLDALLAAALEIAAPHIAAKKHRLEVVNEAPECTIDADPLRMAQVLANLLTNAAKYTDSGGLIVLRASVIDGTVVLSVRDNGIGLVDDALEHVFTMFSQERALLDRSEGGLGIGLALVKALVELHGGNVKATSAGAGMGCDFQVRLPLG